MKKRTPFMLLLFALLIASCVQSLHPLYTQKELVFEPKLVGTWESEGGNLWIFLKSSEKSYDLIYTEKETPAKFAAHLVKLGTHRFLDLYPISIDLKNDLQQAHLLPTHMFFRVWLDKDTLRLATLEHDWLKKMIDEKKISTQHEVVDRRVVLTAPTAELQQLVVAHADDHGAFPKPRTGLTRRRQQ
jgi:hypothetical protein